jgi:hypothetical protein
VRNSWSNLARQSDFHVIDGFFNLQQSCDMGQTALLPLRRKACWGFFLPEKSDSFSWVWSRELGYRRPAFKPLDHWICFEDYLGGYLLKVTSSWLLIYTDRMLSLLYSWCLQEAFHPASKTCGSRVDRARSASTLGIRYGTTTRRYPASSSHSFDLTEHTYGIRILKELLQFISVWWALRRWPTLSVSRATTGAYTYTSI